MTKTAIITGTSSGIGRAAARAFRAAGWWVVGVSRRGSGDDVDEDVRLDLGAADVDVAARACFDGVVKPGVIALVHNAAVLEKDHALELDAASFARVLQLNVVVPAVLNRILAPHMRPGSSILYVGSTLSERAVQNTASYVTSKHALVGLMRATCQDAAPRGIHTACICPGFVDTEMLRAHVNDADVLAALADRSGHGRLIQADEIARLLVSCAEQPVVDGAVIHANLGQVER